MAKSLVDRLLSPWVVLGLLAVLLALGALLAPLREEGFTVPILSSHFAAEGGALGLYRTAERLGWRVDRRERPMRSRLDSSAVYAVLGPPQQLTSSEVTELLGAVWRGAGLIMIAQRETPLADSLGVQSRRTDDAVELQAASSLALEDRSTAADDTTEGVWSFPHARRVLTFERSQNGVRRFLQAPDAPDSSTQRAGSAEGSAVAAGFRYGRGRVVAISDPYLLRNVSIRETAMGVATVRMLEWVRPPGANRLIFDEYHFGYGERLGFFELVADAMLDSRLGRSALVMLSAALLLLMAIAPRPLVPPFRQRIERRSPLEHVFALARAYEQVGASRTAMRRLLHGLKRRHAVAQRESEDQDLLRAIKERAPSLAPELQEINHALIDDVSNDELLAAGRALQRVEAVAFSTNETRT